MGHSRKSGRRLHPDAVPTFTKEKLEGVATPRTLEKGLQLANSDRIFKRVLDGVEISCVLVGEMGQRFSCSVHAKKFTLQGLCSCDSYHFCEHLASLVLTYLDHPETFLNLDDYLTDLDGLPKEELVQRLRRLVAQYPASALEALGEEGFDSSQIDDMEEPLPFDALDSDALWEPDWPNWEEDSEDDDEDDDPPTGGTPLN